jgi:histidinol-phosphate/aromatic aminotransferase/cobyric acid decarboxylase-like protein/choline kinase
MQAIILAAGMGRRLGEYTRDNTKCMLPINGQRLIDRDLDQLSKLNLNRVIIVVGYKGKNLIDHIGHCYDDSLKIEYINNPVYDKTNNIYSLSLAKDKLMEDDTILMESDLIFEESILNMLVDNPFPNLALVAKYETWMDGTMVRIDEDNNIVDFVSKQAFSYQDVNLYYKTVNIYKFSKEFSRHKYVPFLNAYCEALGNNEYYEQVLRVITFLDSSDIKALPIGNRKWYEIDDVQDLDIAETIFASKEELMNRYNRRYGGHWRFPKLLDFCYLVNPYFPTERMKDELRANFDTLLTEYPSGMYVNSLLGGKYFGVKQKYTIVGNGAAELIKSLMERIAGKIGIIYPTFEEYPNRRNPSDIVPFMPKARDFSYGISELEQFYEDKNVHTILIINPDNPSGNFIPVVDILKFTLWCKNRDIQLIVDESFVDFTDNFTDNSLFKDDILENYPNLIVMKSISKSYGVPGLRLGIMASSDSELIDWMKKDVSIWNINSFAEFYMQIFGKYIADYERACNKFIYERSRFLKELQQIPYLTVIPSQANYFLVKINGRFTSGEITQSLLEKYDILIKDCDSKNGLKGKNFVRIAIRGKKDNDILIKALRKL